LKRLIIYPTLFTIVVAIATKGFASFDNSFLFYPMIATFVYFTVFYIIAQIVKDNSIIDMGWGAGFIVGSTTAVLLVKTMTVFGWVVYGFILLWGLRLTIRLVGRNWGKPEDFRYQAWRVEWGKKAWLIAFFRVFMIQGIINFIVGSVPYFLIVKSEAFNLDMSLTTVLFALGIIISLVGLFFEVVGDAQLANHIKKKTGALLDYGLWSKTRHPNYFGEILIWVGFYIAGIGLLNSNDFFYLFLVLSPLVMTTVFTKISTPLLEKHMEKYDGWEAYTKKVPMIFPFLKP
jgi:steroid 5-alpha reductase family enzyme